MIRGPLPSCAEPTQLPQNPSACVETAGKREEEERENKGKEVRLDVIQWKKRVWSPCLRHIPPLNIHTLDTARVWLCVSFVGLADRFASVHHCRLTCAFTGRYRCFGHCLSYIMQRWLSVHGNWRSRHGKKRKQRDKGKAVSKNTSLPFWVYPFPLATPTLVSILKAQGRKKKSG